MNISLFTSVESIKDIKKKTYNEKETIGKENES